jgi:hypothetical protein
VKAIEEGYIRFEFGESWTVVEKWDAAQAYRDGLQKLSGALEDEHTGQRTNIGSRAVDIIGVRRDDLYLIEVKDYRGYAIATKKRQTEELPLLIGCKVRDTVAGLVGASRSNTAPAPWVETCARLLVERRRRVYVIAWIADPPLRVPEPRTKRSIWQKQRSDSLKQRLAWLTPYVAVMSPLDASGLDVATQSLPGAGRS